jgi:hypothetical protein
MPKIGDSIDLHQYWFITSADDGETWQLTDGPFTEREAFRVKEGMTAKWVIVQIKSAEGVR